MNIWGNNWRFHNCQSRRTRLYWHKKKYFVCVRFSASSKVYITVIVDSIIFRRPSNYCKSLTWNKQLQLSFASWSDFEVGEKWFTKLYRKRLKIVKYVVKKNTKNFFLNLHNVFQYYFTDIKKVSLKKYDNWRIKGATYLFLFDIHNDYIHLRSSPVNICQHYTTH